MILVFDLDDTLYKELDYVKGGLLAVAGYLEGHLKDKPEEIHNKLLWLLEKNGRGKIFDDLLLSYQKMSKQKVNNCLQVYRQHHPNIHLQSDVKELLERLPHKKYIVTDGNKHVQNRKIEALGLRQYMKHCFITRRYGIDREKPSTYCFERICEREKVSANKLVYIGDNPNKDFVGVKKMGAHTIRILQGPFKDLKVEKDYDADHYIQTLNRLEDALKGLS